MKKYGLILTDIGSDFFISGAPDERWNNDDLSQLKNIKATDFEVVQMGEIISNDTNDKMLSYAHPFKILTERQLRKLLYLYFFTCKKKFIIDLINIYKFCYNMKNEKLHLINLLIIFRLGRALATVRAEDHKTLEIGARLRLFPFPGVMARHIPLKVSKQGKYWL